MATEKTKAELEAELIALKAQYGVKEDDVQKAKDDAAIRAYLEEEVPIQLFKDGEQYNDDLVICLNGVTVKIKRGIPVMIKRKYKFLIDEAQIQGVVAADAIHKAEDECATMNELKD